MSRLKPYTGREIMDDFDEDIIEQPCINQHPCPPSTDDLYSPASKTVTPNVGPCSGQFMELPIEECILIEPEVLGQQLDGSRSSSHSLDNPDEMDDWTQEWGNNDTSVTLLRGASGVKSSTTLSRDPTPRSPAWLTLSFSTPETLSREAEDHSVVPQAPLKKVTEDQDPPRRVSARTTKGIAPQRFGMLLTCLLRVLMRGRAIFHSVAPILWRPSAKPVTKGIELNHAEFYYTSPVILYEKFNQMPKESIETFRIWCERTYRDSYERLLEQFCDEEMGLSYSTRRKRVAPLVIVAGLAAVSGPASIGLATYAVHRTKQLKEELDLTREK